MILCFGEIMLRLGAPKGCRMEQAMPGALESSFGGSESSVAASLARFGTPAHYITALPPGPLKDAFEHELRGLGARVTVRETPGKRFGLYFIEHGAGPRGGTVTYDRAGSGVAETLFADYQFDEVLGNAAALHISGITPAISRTACETTLQLVEAARKRGLYISCDLNYRAKLWNWDEHKSGVDLAREWMPQIVKHLDLLIGNESDFSDMLNLTSEDSAPEAGVVHADGYLQVAKQAAAMFPRLKTIASSLRESRSADVNFWGGMLYDVAKDQVHFAPLGDGIYQPYELQITDRFGAGDAFAGGLIHALFSEDLCDPENALQFAVAASALKHTIHGDYNRISRDEVIRLMQGNLSGRVQR